MNIITSVILGIVQGLTEFLPVSSSGHLVIAETLFGLTPSLPFIVLLHLGTLIAVCVYFWKDIWEIISNFFAGLWTIISGKEPFRHIYYSNTGFKIGCLIIIGSIFTGALALTFKDIFEILFSSIFAVGCFLILTGIIIILAEWIGKGKRMAVQTGVLDAVIIGLAQGIAVAPGLSRAGTTVSAALSRNIERKFAAKFSFLLSIPAILGAGIVKAKELAALGSTSEGFSILIFGFIAAAASGYLAIKVFMAIIQRMSIRMFAYYTLVLGIILIILK